jgi:general nucleoside transport system permease protein
MGPVTAPAVVSRIAAVLAAGAAVALAWLALVTLGDGSVAATAGALAGAGLLRPESLAAAATAGAPLLLAGLALAVGLRAGVVNLGIQGQALAGALAAMEVEHRLRAPGFVVLATAVVAAMAAGLAWTLLPALLRAWRGVPEALTTMVGSFGAVALIAAVPLAWRPADPLVAGIGNLSEPLRRLAGGAAWPALLSWTVPVALAGALALALALRATTVGPRLRAMLSDQRAALLAGVRPRGAATGALLLSGAVAGLVGLQDVLSRGAPVAGGLGTVAISGAAPLAGPSALTPVPVAYLPDYGLLAIAVVLAGRASGLGMVAAALALSLLDHAGAALGGAAGLSAGTVIVLQLVLVIAAVLAARVVSRVTAARLAGATRRPAHVAGAKRPTWQRPRSAGQQPRPAGGPGDERRLEPTVDDAEGAHA